jgi:hypothetical protein
MALPPWFPSGRVGNGSFVKYLANDNENPAVLVSYSGRTAGASTYYCTPQFSDNIEGTTSLFTKKKVFIVNILDFPLSEGC